MAMLELLGREVRSEVVGAGEPVLLLHGGFCSLESLQPQADALAGDHRVLAFERPGHGRSPDVEGDYSYAEGVAQALAYLDAMRVGSAHVIGYSDGGIIGLLLARDHPERVRSLVAISANLDPSAFAGPAEAAPAGETGAAGPAPTGPLVLDERPAGAPAQPEDRPDPEREAYDRLSPDGPAHADAVLGKLMRLWTTQPDIAPPSLAAISAPVLVMSGDRDTVRPDHSLLIAASIPGAQLCIVPGATHALVSERPAFIAGVVRGFLPSTRETA